MTIKLSIITATWNSAATLPATLSSLDSQSCQEFESIVIDGGSSDETIDIVKSSSSVNHWISEKDLGIYDALNKGIKIAQGEYVGFMHSDDIFASNESVEHLLEHIERYKPDAVYADLQYVKKDNVGHVVRYWCGGEYDVSKLKMGWMPPHPTFYMKRSLYQKYGLFDLSYKIAADYDSLVRYLYLYNVNASYLPKVLVKMRLGGESNRSLNNVFRKSREDFAIMKRAGIPVFIGMIWKNLSKLPQFVKRKKSLVERF